MLKRGKPLYWIDIGVDNIFKRRDLVEGWWQQSFGCNNPQRNGDIRLKTLETIKGKNQNMMGTVPRDSYVKTCLERYRSKLLLRFRRRENELHQSERKISVGQKSNY